MSETIAPALAASSPPSSPEPGSGLGAPPPVAAVEAVAPAAFSPPDAPAPAETESPAPAPAAVEAPVPAAAEAPAPDGDKAKDSLLSTLTNEKDAKAEEKPAEAPKDAPPVEAAEAVERPAPTYEPFTLPDGVQVNEERLTGFTGLLGEFENRIAADPTKVHEAFQELGQKALELYTTEAADFSQRMARLQRETWERTREGWLDTARNDPEIGRNRWETNLSRMGGLMDMYGAAKGPDALNAVREAFTLTGAGDHPAVLAYCTWLASRLTETAKAVVPIVPRAPVVTSRAQRLYRNTNSGAA